MTDQQVTSTDVWQSVPTPDQVVEITEQAVLDQIEPIANLFISHSRLVNPTSDGKVPLSIEIDWSRVVASIGESIIWTPLHLEMLNRKMGPKGWSAFKQFNNMRGAGKDADYLLFTKTTER